MYNKLKQAIKALIPNRMLFKYEPYIRSVLYQFYKGRNFQCNICNKKLNKFQLSKDGDNLCPYCGSLSRTRRLWQILHADYLKAGIHVLDFSPSRSIYRALKKTPGIYYKSTDISGDFLSDEQYDITKINTNNELFDIIICYHVLEHINNDSQAIQELYRVLKKGGTCLIQTPFKEGEIYEDPSIITEQDRLVHFGQRDHVRIYGVNGLRDRLVKGGFYVTIKQYSEPENNTFGYKVQEKVLICTK